MNARAELALAAVYPLRWCAARLARRNPLRLASVQLLRRIGRRLRYAETRPHVVPLDAPGLRFAAGDSMVTDAIFWFGARGYEGVLCDVWRRLAARSHSILEIGGNIGFYTVLGAVANPGARYRVVEPNPEVAAVLRGNLALNGLTQVELIQAAAIPGALRETVRLGVPDDERGVPVGSYLMHGTEGIDRPARRTIDCDGLPMRELLDGTDLVKIDAEGIEHALLDSAAEQIVAQRPVIVVEVLPESVKLGALIRGLAQRAGYHIYAVPGWGSDAVVRFAAAAFDPALLPRFHSKDVILSPQPLDWPARDAGK